MIIIYFYLKLLDFNSIRTHVRTSLQPNSSTNYLPVNRLQMNDTNRGLLRVNLDL